MGFFLVIVTSFVAGVMNAIAGGGTFLTFPALTYVGGLGQKVANITSTIGLWPGSASSVVAAFKDFVRIPRGMLISFSIISLLGLTLAVPDHSTLSRRQRRWTCRDRAPAAAWAARLCICWWTALG